MSGIGSSNGFNGVFNGDISAESYIMEILIVHRATGEGVYKLYTKDGHPYYLADTYYYTLAQMISLNSTLIAALSIYPFNPIASVGGYDLGYTLYINSITCPDGIKEIQGSATRVQSDGTVTAGNMIMLGSSVSSTISWDDAGSYLANANTLFNWSETYKAEGDVELNSSGYIDVSATQDSPTGKQQQLELDLTSASYIDVIVKVKANYDAVDNDLGNVNVIIDSSVSANTALECLGVGLNPNTINAYGSVTGYTGGGLNSVARDDSYLNIRVNIDDDGSWILQKLVGGVPTDIIEQGATYLQCNAPNTWSDVFLKIRTASTEDSGDTYNGLVDGIYIYWEN